jgi:mRNA interferase HicA
VKRNEFILLLLAAGCVLHRHGSRHDIYLNPATGQKQPVPRHTDIDEQLVKHIKKQLAIAVR